MNKERLEVINFTNISEKEWTHTFGGKPYTFAPGQTKAFPRFMAEFFAKHLGDRILLDAGKDFAMDSKDRIELNKKILGNVAVPAEAIIAEADEVKEPEFEDLPKEEPKVEDVKLEDLELYVKPKATEATPETAPEPKKRGTRRKKA
jgi:hypothetical protein